jgi:hypothetical protein
VRDPVFLFGGGVIECSFEHLPNSGYGTASAPAHLCSRSGPTRAP